MTQTRLSACDRADLLDRYARGERVKDLAERFGVHRGTVRALAARAGLPPRKASEHPRQVREEAVELYANGLSLLKVGRRLGISDDAVRDAVVAAGGTIRPRGRHAPVR
ncbi:hypothetical protein GCM10009713_23930 [Brevibacterium celere]|nr:helix-turn-helix domain-containing protein [Brevibacterium sp. W7.2]